MSEAESGGTIAAEINTIEPWPPLRETLVARMEIATGKLTLCFTPDGRLRASVSAPDGASGEATSGRLLAAPNTTFRAAVRCTGDFAITIAASGQIVGESGNQTLYNSSFTLRPAKGAGAIADLAERNEKARARRREMAAARSPRPHRKRMPIEYAVSGLRRELLQLDDLLNACRDGRRHHVFGVAARLRLLIAHGANSHPLLQFVAGSYDLPLIVHALDHAIDQLEDGMDAIGSFSLREASEPGTIAIDLDAWLELQGAIVEGAPYTINKMIRAIADTVGAHFDPDLEPLVELLDSMESGTPAGVLSEFDRWVLNTAYCVKQLGHNVMTQVTQLYSGMI